MKTRILEEVKLLTTKEATTILGCHLETLYQWVKAAVAIAHKILVSIYHMFSQQVSYNDLGDLYLDKLNKNCPASTGNGESVRPLR